MVLPLPDEPALQTLDRLERLHVLVEAAVGVAHGVGELTEDQGPPVIGSPRGPGRDVLDRRVHRADDVGGGGGAVEVLHDGALVVQRPGRIDTANPGRCGVVPGAVARLVAQRPGDHARVVAVPQHHARHALDDGGVVAGVVTQAEVPGVALDVRLVHHVETQLVTQVVEPVVVGVVRAAHGVGIGALHGDEVVAHVLHRHRSTAVGVIVVAVHAPDAHGRTVDQQLAVAHCHRTEPDALGHHRAHGAVGIVQPHEHPVELGVLGRPGPDPGEHGG